MKTLIRCITLAALLATSPAATAAEALRVVVIPWLENEALRQLYTPSVRLLERKLGTPVQLQIAQDYDEVTQRLVAGAADIGIYGPAGYVRAKARHPEIRYLVTCLLPDDHYFSLVFVHRNSPVRSLADARGRSIGMADAQSTSGYLVPRRMFLDAGIDVDKQSRVFLLGKHFRVFDGVAGRTIEIGAADSGAWDAAVQSHGDVFRLIARSAPLPRDPLAAAPHVSAALATRIQAILVDAGRDADFARAKSELRGYSVRDDRFYDAIREISGR